MSIHKRDCSNVQASLTDPSNEGRWVRAYWEDNVQENFKATLEIFATDRDGLLGDIAVALGELRVPIYA